MAERLSSYDFSKRKRATKYPWDEWLDGSVWRITQGVDFTLSLRAMQSSVIIAARRVGRCVTTRVEGEHLILQALPAAEVPRA